MPEAAALFVEVFADLGMAASSGFGAVPLSYVEIAAGVPWADTRERALIRQMSRDYLRGRDIGDDPFGMPPWEG